jgi:hypothetical protein
LVIVILSAKSSGVPAAADTETAETAEIVEEEQIYAPVFSLTEHFFTESQVLKMSYRDGWTIYYTIDGTKPTEDSILYDDSVGVSIESTRGTNVYPVQARAVNEYGAWSDTTYNTYIAGKFVNIDRFFTLVVSITTDPANFFDYEYGIYIEGKLRDDYIRDNPRAEINPPAPANFNLRGMDGERPVHVEFFTKNGERVIDQDAGVRIYGGWSRANPLKSLKLYARKNYSVSNFFDYAFFGEDVDYAGNKLTKYKELVLRNAGNDFYSAYIRDELIHTLAEQAGFPDTEKVVPVSAFVNGEYFGCYWIHESYCDEYFESRYGPYEGQFMELRQADTYRTAEDDTQLDAVQDYADMYAYSSKDLTNDAIYAELCELLDVENYLTYFAINIYVDNEDWPHNNDRTYRYYTGINEEYREAPFDGKFRFLIHDTDYSSGIYTSNMQNSIARVTGRGHGQYSPMFTALLKRDDCLQFFVDKMLELMNGAFSAENFTSVLSKMNASRYVEMDNFYATGKYAPHRSAASMVSSTNALKAFGEARPAYMLNLLKQLYGSRISFDEVTLNE